MYQNLRIVIIIPAYREEERIEGVVRGLPSWVDHIVVVDDGSTDRTFERASSIADQRLVVVHHGQNQGACGATGVSGGAARAAPRNSLTVSPGSGIRMTAPRFHADPKRRSPLGLSNG
jgi:GT2 family glycosyltransferase